MADRTGIELARVGEFDLSTGKQKFTPKMLRNAAERAQAAGAGYRAPLKLGHTDPRNDEVAAADGEPAFGWLHNLRTQGDGDTTVLLGDVTGMPDWLAEIAPTAYPDRSIEGYASDEAETLDITALSLLGVTPPGMPTIKTWRDLPQAFGVAASAPKLIAASFTAANDAAPQTPAAEPVVIPPNPKEADPMSDTLNKGQRQRLGVKDDANLDEAGLLTALDQALKETADPPAITPEAIAASFKLTPEQVKTALAAAAKLPAEGSVTISQDVLDELKIAAAAGAEARAEQLKTARDTTIMAAVRAGKIAPARKDHWMANWDKDPEGVAASIAALEVLYPVAASGGNNAVEFSDDEGAADFDRLFSRPAVKEA
jgi:hypothetical protein